MLQRMIMLGVLLCALGTLVAALGTDPILMLNTEMHTNRIIKISVDAAEKHLLTCSDDKSARLWDLNSGQLLRVLRPPIDNANNGMLYSCALSPDGRIAAVGGWTIDAAVDTCLCVYLFDTASGMIIHKISPLPEVILDLQFSPGGDYLAMGLGDYGVRVFRCSDWQRIALLRDYLGPVYSLDFDYQGRLATVCYDGFLRLYDSEFQLLSKRQFLPPACPYCVAFNPEGNRIAVGFDQNKQIQVLSDQTLETLYEPDVSGSDEDMNYLCNVCFSRDGRQLCAGGYFKDPQHAGRIIRVWQNAGQGAYTDYPVAESTISDLANLRDGLVFAGANPDWGRLAADYSLKLHLVPEKHCFLDIDKSHLRINGDGTEIGFKPWGYEPLRFLINTRELESRQSSEAAFKDSIPGYRISDWFESLEPKLNGNLLCVMQQDDYEASICVDIIPQLREALLGCIYNLYCLDAEGSVFWKTPTQAMVAAVNASGDGKIAVTLQSDGTIRWYRVSDGNLLLNMFINTDLQRWILWTPAGYYDCSPQAENMIGWHVNQGPDKESIFYPIAQFRETYFRPDVIDLILSTLDEDEAVRQANLEAGIAVAAAGVSQILPPAIKITSPVRNSGFSTAEMLISYSFANLNNEPVTSLKVLLDGRPYKIFKNLNTLETHGSVRIELPPRNVRVGLIAENKFGKSQMDDVKLLWQGSVAPGAAEEPQARLFVLAVGIADYLLDAYDLKFAAKDAGDFSHAIAGQKGSLYSQMAVKVLTNNQASRDSILGGLHWLQESCSSRDVAMIFLSGHGYNDNIGRFYYLPVAADITRLRATGIPFSDFEETLSLIPGKVILFVDACHSGAIYSGEKPPDVTRLVNTLSSDDVGVVIFTSSTPRQVSWESEVWQNGAFTKALVEGLSGSADFIRNKCITVKELDLYVSDRVKNLAAEIGKVQTPTTITPQSIPDFAICTIP